MQTRLPISISLDSKTRIKLDKARGIVSRSRFAEELILVALKENKAQIFPKIKRFEDD